MIEMSQEIEFAFYGQIGLRRKHTKSKRLSNPLDDGWRNLRLPNTYQATIESHQRGGGEEDAALTVECT
jgi:hypothetical protein